MDFDLELIITIISAFAAFIASIFTVSGQTRLTKLQAELAEKREEKAKKRDAEAILSKYREPLINAAYELQSRIFNILKLGFLKKFYLNGSPREKEYAVENTIYVIAQYLGWTEIIRRDIQFLDLGELETTQKLSELDDHICNLFLDSKLGKILRIFRGDQRAIGELMITSNKYANSAYCLGYAKFIQRSQDEDFKYWFNPLREQLDILSTDEFENNTERLQQLQHALVDLMDFLDPNYIRHPQERRKKIEL